MPAAAIVSGLLLCVIAAVGYFGSTADKPSPTALIPAIFGLPLMLCGALALVEKYRKHAMHVAAAIGLLGAIGALGRGLPKIGDFFATDPDVNTRPVLMILLMAAVCVVFVGLCVHSFIQARKRQAAQSPEPPEQMS